MKNLKEMGKVLSREIQQNIFGGISVGSSNCYSSCLSDDHCGDPNHSCVGSPCLIIGEGYYEQYLCRCTSGNA